MKDLSKSLRLEYLQYKELLQMTQLRTTGLSREAEARLKRGEAINQLIVQQKNKPVGIEEQILYLFALSKGFLDNLSSTQIAQFKHEILAYIEGACAGYSAEIRKTRMLSDETKGRLEQALAGYFKKMEA